MDSPAPVVDPAKTKLRTVVADDTPESLRLMVEALGDRCDVVATTPDGMEALAPIQRFQPEIAVLDLTMPGLSGLEVADAGVRGYVFKSNIFSELLEAV